ncbi:hypothetical protein AKJ16_DCAP24441 [Drosera capensis]
MLSLLVARKDRPTIVSALNEEPDRVSLKTQTSGYLERHDTLVLIVPQKWLHLEPSLAKGFAMLLTNMHRLCKLSVWGDLQPTLGRQGPLTCVVLKLDCLREYPEI